jgi:hypothetical protein
LSKPYHVALKEKEVQKQYKHWSENLIDPEVWLPPDDEPWPPPE